MSTIDKSLATVKDKTKLLQQHNKRPHEDDPGETVQAPEKRLNTFETPEPQPQTSHTTPIYSESDQNTPAASPPIYSEFPQVKVTVFTKNIRPYSIKQINEKTTTVIIWTTMEQHLNKCPYQMTGRSTPL